MKINEKGVLWRLATEGFYEIPTNSTQFLFRVLAVGFINFLFAPFVLFSGILMLGTLSSYFTHPGINEQPITFQIFFVVFLQGLVLLAIIGSLFHSVLKIFNAIANKIELPIK